MEILIIVLVIATPVAIYYARKSKPSKGNFGGGSQPKEDNVKPKNRT